MADKEPRRRKKRKDVPKKVHFSDDRAEDSSFMSQKSDSRDSDQETEEEFVVPTHQPSKIAKLVFLLLFSGLVVSMSLVFISLKGAERGPNDLFDLSHAEEHVEEHDKASEVAHEESQSWNIFDTTTHDEDPLPDIESTVTFDQVETKSEESNDHDTSQMDEDFRQSSSEDESVVTDFVQVPDAEVQQDDVLLELNENEEEELEHSDIPVIEETISATVETFTVAVEEDIQDDDNDDQGELSPFELNDINSVPEETEMFLETPVEESVTESAEFTPTMSPDEPQPSIAEVDDSPSVIFDDPAEEISLYENADITNEEDYVHREELDSINRVLEKSPEKALKMCEELLQLRPKSPRLLYMKSQALDHLAESQRSNKYLEESIAAYQTVLSLKDVPEKLYIMAGNRAADRMRFRGLVGKSLKLLVEMSQKFPNNIDIKNQVAVGYLLIGQNKESKKAFLEILKLAPDCGFAKVHLGFILKTDELNYNESIKLLSEGIASKEPGVVDGRFYFHLGDALHRIGRQEEAMKVYEDGVKEGVFLSAYQRSLYNVKSLTAKPWWEIQDTPYSAFFKILENNWLAIKAEALSLIDEKNSGFMPEVENLQDTGDWKQFELFARGRKIEKNCMKAPTTCALVEKMPDAAGCKRGQVKFSIMQPATHVWAHTGPTNCRLRSHLGLVIPDGVSIRVANETRQWKEGKILLFDDSFEHEVWHNGKSLRLVLIVDFWHPELTTYQKNTLTPI